MNQSKSKSEKMSENDKQTEGFFKSLINKILPNKGDKKQGKRNSVDHRSDNTSDLQMTIPIAPKRKSKAPPPPPSEPADRKPSTLVEQSHCVKYSTETGDVMETNIDEMNAMFSELTIKESDSGSQNLSLPRAQIKFRSGDSQLQKKINRSKSTKSDVVSQVHQNLPELLTDFNANKNQNIGENSQSPKKSQNVNIKNTIQTPNCDHKNVTCSVIPKSEPAIVEDIKFQDNSKNYEGTLEIKNFGGEQSNIILENVQPNNEVQRNSPQILESETYKIENEKFNAPEDKICKSLNEEIEKQRKVKEALEEIKSVMEEVENIKLDIQKVNDPEQFFMIETGLTNSMIKLDGIPTCKNEFVKQERKRGIIVIQELFKLLDKQPR